jgi:hypothetical protein
MAPESQTLFSITLFLALSSLLAWSNHRNRGARQMSATVGVSPVRGDDSVKL